MEQDRAGAFDGRPGDGALLQGPRRQFEDRWSSVHERLGLSIDDVKGIAGGDVGLGIIAPKPGQAVIAIVVDVTGKLTQAQELLQKTAASQVQRGAKPSEVKVDDNTILQFDLPEAAESQEAGRSTLKGSARAEGEGQAAKANRARRRPSSPGRCSTA